MSAPTIRDSWLCARYKFSCYCFHYCVRPLLQCRAENFAFGCWRSPVWLGLWYKFHHITPVFRHFHWFPVHQRIKYKLAMRVYKCLHESAQIYLADDCLAISAIAGKRHLRSAHTRLLSIPRTTTTLRMRSFAVAGSSGTVYQPLCVPQLSPLWCSLNIWRPTCLADQWGVWRPFMTCSTNPLIIIIITGIQRDSVSG